MSEKEAKQKNEDHTSEQLDKEKPKDQAKKNIGIVFFINLIFSVVEFVFGFIFNSVSIMSDALHDLGDAISTGFAWFFQKYSEKERNNKYTFGYSRFSLLGALVTAVVLLGGSLFIIYRSIPRLIDPEPVDVTGMIWLSIVAIVLNGYATILLRRGSSKNESVLSLHMLEDVLGWIGVLIVSIAMHYTDWYRLDPILSMLIAGYIFYLTFPQLISTMKILLNRAPEEADVKKIVDKIKNLTGVKDISDFHIWSIDGEENALVVTVLLESADISKKQKVKENIRKIARENHVQDHVTIEVVTDEEDFRNKGLSEKKQYE
ncbi:cation diffusion facilitator family transporter [Alkalibacterium kapii]|uniref:Cation transporter n=1 Tax=Alkalibacterium kapii TaxID=426704 RepID=A0A511AQZ9_9LACT|nr:cation diffusion facilitator family transporter [Alkalibacterium kapii]GEK90506.1 cation transporter [Alkalibacterium kapii]